MNDNLIPLVKLDDWKLEHHRQDIRGWPVRDGGGDTVGTVSAMLVDREHERVAAVRLSDGSTVPVELISICDQHVELRPAAASTDGADRGDAIREERIPLVEEQIKIGKREVETGGVRVHSKVVEEPVHEEIRLRDEHVEVERRPVKDGGFKPEYAPDLLRDREVEMREKDEEAVVQKQAIVTEELVVRKEVRDRVEHVDETVRRTEVDVEQLGETR